MSRARGCGSWEGFRGVWGAGLGGAFRGVPRDL